MGSRHIRTLKCSELLQQEQARYEVNKSELRMTSALDSLRMESQWGEGGHRVLPRGHGRVILTQSCKPQTHENRMEWCNFASPETTGASKEVGV